MIQSHPMNESEKESISARVYEGKYKIYNLPPHEEQRVRQLGFWNPTRAKSYDAYYDGTLFIGFTNIIKKETEASIGVGVRPSLCGQGYGQRILLQAVKIAQDRYPGVPLALTVRTWNRRAVSCYEKAGFQIDGIPFEQVTAIGRGLFYRMVRRMEQETAAL